jgi:hypothetical protein
MSNESAKAYEAYLLYQGMGPARSTAKVGREVGKSKRQIDEWSHRWGWVERVRAWDEQLAEKTLETTVERHRAMIERHIEFSHKMQEIVIDRLKTANPQELTVKDVQAWIALSVKIERVCRGLPAEGPGPGAQPQVNMIQGENVQINQQFGEAMADYMDELLQDAPPAVAKWIDDKIKRRVDALGPGELDGGERAVACRRMNTNGFEAFESALLGEIGAALKILPKEWRVKVFAEIRRRREMLEGPSGESTQAALEGE